MGRVTQWVKARLEGDVENEEGKPWRKPPLMMEDHRAPGRSSTTQRTFTSLRCWSTWGSQEASLASSPTSLWKEIWHNHLQRSANSRTEIQEWETARQKPHYNKSRFLTLSQKISWIVRAALLGTFPGHCSPYWTVTSLLSSARLSASPSNTYSGLAHDSISLSEPHSHPEW